MTGGYDYIKHEGGDEMTGTVTSILISGLSMAFAIFFGINTAVRSKKKDDRQEASEMTTVIVKLESISDNIKDIKADMMDIKDDLKHQGEQIIRIDESLKSAWKQINMLTERKEE